MFADVDRSRLLALLVKQLDDFALAEDALQDAFLSATEHWGKQGTPANPSAWLLRVARRKAIDQLRRHQNWRRKQAEVLRLAELDQWAAEPEDEQAIPDERLSLIFTCCHPALDRQASVALTLRTLCGLTTDEIARAFVVSPRAMAQRLVRVQQKLTAARIPYAVPAREQLAERLDAVLTVIYLIFNEGYAASGTQYLRRELCDEAMRLAALVADALPDEMEAQGLCALLALHRARFETRIGADGIPRSLEEQDRAQWDHVAIADATARLESTLARRTPGPFQLQAAVAALHAEAPQFHETDWAQIAALYQRLHAMTGNPVFRLNQVVALSYRGDLTHAVLTLQSLSGTLHDYQPFHAALADLCARAGRLDDARAAYAEALRRSPSSAEKAFLQHRLDKLGR